MNDGPTPFAYTIPDASTVSGIPRTGIYELVGTGVLDARKAGRRTLITADSLRAYLASLPSASIRAPRKAAYSRNEKLPTRRESAAHSCSKVCHPTTATDEKLAKRRHQFKPGNSINEVSPLYISHKFPMAYGRALVSEPRGMTIPTDPAAALAFAVRVDREADTMLAAGRFEQAERLSHAALEARCRPTGDRA